MAIRLQYLECVRLLLSKEPNLNLAAPKHTLQHIHRHPEVRIHDIQLLLLFQHPIC